MLRFLSFLSLFITVSMGLAFTSMRTNSLGFGKFKISLESKYLSGPFLSCCLVLALYVYRTMCAIPKRIFYCYVIANTVIMITFSLIRFYAISLTNNNISFYFLFFSITILAMLMGITRFFFNMGFQIEQNPHLVLTLLHRFGQPSMQLFSNVGRKITGNSPINPGSSGFDRHFALGVGTFVAASVTAGGAIYVGYEAYQSRLLNQRTTIAAEASAKAAYAAASAEQQKTEIKAVKHGLMSKEEYFKKYPPQSP